MRDQLLREAALADAGLADEQEQATAAGERIIESGDELGELGLAAHKRAASRLGHRLGHRAAVESRILHEDRLVKLAEPTAGFDAELLDERPSRYLVGLERLGLAPGPVEAEHQLAEQTLPQRVLLHQPLQLAGEFGVATGGEIGVDPLLERRQAQLPETSALRLRKRLIGEVGERRPAPQRKCLAQLLRSRLGHRRCRPRRRAAQSGRRRARSDRPATRSRACG